MKVVTLQSGADKTLPLASRASSKTYTARKAPMPPPPAYRAAEKTIPGLTTLKRKYDESVEQDYESEVDQDDGDSDQVEEDEGQEEEEDSGSEDDDGEAEINTSHSAEIKQDSKTSSDSESSSSDSETGFGAVDRSKNVFQAGEDGSRHSKDDFGAAIQAEIDRQSGQSEGEKTNRTSSLNKELFGEDNDAETPEDETAAVASRKRKSVEKGDDYRKAAKLLQTALQLPSDNSTVRGSSNARQSRAGHHAKKRSGERTNSQAKKTGRYDPQSLQDWALPVDADTKFVDGSPYRPIPKNEQMVARCQEAKMDKLHPSQLAEWLKIHGTAVARKSHAELLQLVQKVVDDHTKMRPGDLLPAGYTSFKDVTGIAQPSVEPRSLASSSQGADTPADDSTAFASPTLPQSETSFTQQGPVETPQDQQPTSSSTTRGSGQSASASQLVPVQITPAAPSGTYPRRTNEVAGIAWFEQRNVPQLPYIPGQSTDVDMKVHRVKYGYAQDDVWNSRKYQDITMRDIVEAIPPDELHDFDLCQLRGYLRSIGDANVEDTSTKGECMMTILDDVRIHRGLVILGLEHRAQRQGQQVALQRQRYPERNGVIDFTGTDDGD